VIKLGLFFLIPALLIFLILASFGLHKAKSNFASATGMRFAITALWIALILGGLLAIGTAWDSVPLLRQLTSIHVIWAALGWVTVMIVSISYQVIPMFQVAHEYPERFKRFFVLLLFVSLVFLSVQIYIGYSQLILTSIISGLILFFSAISVKILLQRKKRLADASLYFWLTGLFSFVLCVFVFNYGQYFNENLSVLIGFIFLQDLCFPL